MQSGHNIIPVLANKTICPELRKQTFTMTNPRINLIIRKELRPVGQERTKLTLGNLRNASTRR